MAKAALPYNWTESEFNDSVVQLVAALHQQPNSNDKTCILSNDIGRDFVHSKISNGESSSWYWEQRNGKIMLIHPPFYTTTKTMSTDSSISDRLTATQTQSDAQRQNDVVTYDEQNHMFTDSSIWIDENDDMYDASSNENDHHYSIGRSSLPAVVGVADSCTNTITTDMPVTSSTNTHINQTSSSRGIATQTCIQSTVPTCTILEWYLNCIYHDTWSVPVLYFTVQYATTGVPCSRDVILKATELVKKIKDDSRVGGQQQQQQQQQQQIEDSWTIISMEEHPITGLPSYFLHPCHTAERLGTLFAASTTTSDTSITNPRDGDCDGNKNCINGTSSFDEQESKNSDVLYPPGVRLYSWLSMILSTLHILEISSHSYETIYKRLIMREPKKHRNITGM